MFGKFKEFNVQRLESDQYTILTRGMSYKKRSKNGLHSLHVDFLYRRFLFFMMGLVKSFLSFGVFFTMYDTKKVKYIPK